jgi:FkbM family methyltransferase
LLKEYLTDPYSALFGWPLLAPVHQRLVDVSLRGLGVHRAYGVVTGGEGAFLKRIFRDIAAPTVIDVGAYHGEYANAIKHLRPEAKLYACEPHPGAFQILRSSAERNRYRAFNLGLGDRQQRGTLFDYPLPGLDASPHASVYREVIEQIHGQYLIDHFGAAGASEIPIDIETLDNFMLSQNTERLDLLKIDAEGNEVRVLQGAQKAIASGLIDLVHFEFNEMNVASRTFFKDFYDLLPGFEFFRILRHGLLPMGAYVPASCEIFSYQNVVAATGSGLLKIRRG